ncbi:hypothetical protein NHQ30_009880 [Ciborinia camelliae]|nr:hypothetical protein NHQ30_009880 [Ciborinia camelliae]
MDVSYQHDAKRFNDATNYAQQCYSNRSSQMLDCDKFVAKTLPTAISDMYAACPFKEGVCRSNDTNILLDTGYVDSNDDLGLNTPKDQRSLWRYVLHCAPLVTEGRTSQFDGLNESWVRYNYGSLRQGTATNVTLRNFTYQAGNWDTPYVSGNTLAGVNYKLSPVGSRSYQGRIDPSSSAFYPDSTIFRSDGDVTVVFLSGNGVAFSQRLDDDWYRATVPGLNISSAGSPDARTTYKPEEAASPLGCVEQWQWCNSAFERETGCGPLASMQDALYGALSLFNLTSKDLDTERPSSKSASGTRLLWPSMMQGQLSSLWVMLGYLGAKSLDSQSLLYDGIQYSLPQNQWQIDVTNWWNTTLAAVQGSYVDTAMGTTDPAEKSSRQKPENSEEIKICNSQVRVAHPVLKKEMASSVVEKFASDNTLQGDESPGKVSNRSIRGNTPDQERLAFTDLTNNNATPQSQSQSVNSNHINGSYMIRYDGENIVFISDDTTPQ